MVTQEDGQDFGTQAAFFDELEVEAVQWVGKDGGFECGGVGGGDGGQGDEGVGADCLEELY